MRHQCDLSVQVRMVCVHARSDVGVPTQEGSLQRCNAAVGGGSTAFEVPRQPDAWAEEPGGEYAAVGGTLWGMAGMAGFRLRVRARA